MERENTLTRFDIQAAGSSLAGMDWFITGRQMVSRRTFTKMAIWFVLASKTVCRFGKNAATHRTWKISAAIHTCRCRLVCKELTKYLAVSPDNVSAAYEDVFYFYGRREKNPVNIDPLKANLKRSVWTAHTGTVAQPGPGRTCWLVCRPRNGITGTANWRSCKWIFNRNPVFNSRQFTHRLKVTVRVAALVSKLKMEEHVERSLFEELPALEKFPWYCSPALWLHYHSRSATPQRLQQQVTGTALSRNRKEKKSVKEKKEEAEPEKRIAVWSGYDQTALCWKCGMDTFIFHAAGRLPGTLFRPGGIHWNQLQQRWIWKCVLKAMNRPGITGSKVNGGISRPGVIEVNIHPSKTGRSFALIQKPCTSRPGYPGWVQKIYADGRHTGTGGGKHITIGGATPSDSPLLRRPLIYCKAFITFWQHHPWIIVFVFGFLCWPHQPGASYWRRTGR